MKYVSNFNKYISINESLITDSILPLNALMAEIFFTFPSNRNVKKLYQGSELLSISVRIYDYFTDIKSLLQLGENGIQEFGDNLGVGEEDDVVVSIIIKTYEDKYNDNFISDLTDCIEYLQKNKTAYAIQEEYLNFLLELKKLIS